MAPYRSSRTGNRQTRTTQIDYDVFEGLPVRHWRKKQIHVNPAPGKDSIKPVGDVDHGYPELPLPRDFSMLPESSQVLLRASRLGLRKRPRDVEEDKENEEHEAPEAQEESDGFLMSRWNLIPRELEGPEPEYLAKRRKGLPSVYSEAKDANATPMRRLKVRKIDAEGKATVWEALVPEGQEVDGEIIEDDASPTAAAPGTVVEGVGVVNADGLVVAGEQPTPAPVRRRPPIPKKKKKHGPGRGRKKIVEPAPGESGATAANGNSINGYSEGTDLKAPGGDDNEDSVMNDVNNEDEGSDDGSDDGDDDREEGELSPEPGEDLAPKDPHDAQATSLLTQELPPKPSSPRPNAVSISDEIEAKGPLEAVDNQSPAITQSHEGDASLEVKVTALEETVDPRSDADQMDIDTAQAPADPSVSSIPPFEPQVNSKSAEPEDELPSPRSQHHEPLKPDSRSVDAPSVSPRPILTPPMPSIPGLSPQTREAPTSVPTRPPTPPPQLSHQPPPQLSHQPPPPQTSEASPPSPTHDASVSKPLSKAPTPSPPTPLQEAFAQGLSPKAPTMSPPTPIPTDDDFLPEPPSFTLSKDQMVTVGVDGSQETPPPPPPSSIPGLHTQPQQEQAIEVEAAPQIPDPQLNAEIPAFHNPIEGLAAPSIPPPERDLESYAEGKVEVEAAPLVENPKLDAEIPHDHVRMEGLRAPVVPPEKRRLSRSEASSRGGEGEDDVERFSDGDEDLLGTEEKRAMRG